ASNRPALLVAFVCEFDEIDPLRCRVVVNFQRVPLDLLRVAFPRLQLVAGDADDEALAASRALAFGCENPAALEPVEIARCCSLRPEERCRRRVDCQRPDQHHEHSRTMHGRLPRSVNRLDWWMLPRRCRRGQEQARRTVLPNAGALLQCHPPSPRELLM